MFKKVFNSKEMENIFEIGREIQFMIDNEVIEIEDSQDAFTLALQLAVEFEEKFSETDDYYGDLIDFIQDRIVDEFGIDE